MGGEDESIIFNSSHETAIATEVVDSIPFQGEQSSNSLIPHEEPLAANTLGNEQTSTFEGLNSPRQMEVSIMQLADAASMQAQQFKVDFSVAENVIQKQFHRCTYVSAECNQPTVSSVMESAHGLNMFSCQQTGMPRQQLDDAIPAQYVDSNDPCIQHNDPLLHNTLRNAQAGRSEGHSFLRGTEVDAQHQADVMSLQVEQDVNAPLLPFLHSDPLQNELERLCREQEKVIKAYEEEKSQLNSKRERDIEEVHGKYNALIENAEVTCLQEKKALEEWFNKVYLNIMLSEAFKSKVADPPKAGCAVWKEGPSSTLRQQSSGTSVSQTAWRIPHVSALPVHVHNPTDLFSHNPATPCYRMLIPPMPTLQAGIEHRFPAPHPQRTRAPIPPPNHTILPGRLPSPSSTPLRAAASQPPQFFSIPSYQP